MADEKRLIFADVAKEMIVNHANEFSDVLSRREKALLIGGGTSCIDKCPTVEAVEVVRCKDCKHWIADDDVGYCDNPDGLDNYARPDDFCSCGERRTDEATQ